MKFNRTLGDLLAFTTVVGIAYATNQILDISKLGSKTNNINNTKVIENSTKGSNSEHSMMNQNGKNTNPEDYEPKRTSLY